MKMLINISITVVASVTWATPIIVEEVRADRKATVYIPPGNEIKPGDLLYTQPPPVQVIAVPPSTDPVVSEAPQPAVVSDATSEKRSDAEVKLLRPRTHNVAVTYGFVSDKIKFGNGISNVKSDTEALGVSYSRNFGYVQPSFGLGISISDNLTSEVKVTDYVVGIQFNFLENIPGNDLIPYGGIGFGNYSMDEKDTNAGVDSLIDGKYHLLGIGILWYPFGELFALDFSWVEKKGTLDYSGVPALTIDDVKVERRIISLSYVVSF